jgi:hypothetical protein
MELIEALIASTKSQDCGQPCGIDSITGYPLQFPAAFRQSRSFQAKGIVKLIKDKEAIYDKV